MKNYRIPHKVERSFRNEGLDFSRLGEKLRQTQKIKSVTTVKKWVTTPMRAQLIIKKARSKRSTYMLPPTHDYHHRTTMG